jgi:hypothetical protein
MTHFHKFGHLKGYCSHSSHVYHTAVNIDGDGFELALSQQLTEKFDIDSDESISALNIWVVLWLKFPRNLDTVSGVTQILNGVNGDNDKNCPIIGWSCRSLRYMDEMRFYLSWAALRPQFAVRRRSLRSRRLLARFDNHRPNPSEKAFNFYLSTILGGKVLCKKFSTIQLTFKKPSENPFFIQRTSEFLKTHIPNR